MNCHVNPALEPGALARPMPMPYNPAKLQCDTACANDHGGIMTEHSNHALPMSFAIGGHEIVRMIGRGGLRIVNDARNPHTKEHARVAGFIFPDSDRRYLAREEVARLPRERLRIARNEIFARKGRCCKEEARLVRLVPPAHPGSVAQLGRAGQHEPDPVSGAPDPARDRRGGPSATDSPGAANGTTSTGHISNCCDPCCIGPMGRATSGQSRRQARGLAETMRSGHTAPGG